MKRNNKVLLDFVLGQIPRYGWTAEAISAGAQAAGVSAQVMHQAFPQGVTDVVAEFRRSIDAAMVRHIKDTRNFFTLRTRDKVKLAVRVRLEAAAPQREAIRRLLVWSALPQNIRLAMHDLWQIADKIWLAAGDTATDYNYYTKRLLLIAVMKSTLAFWLNDESKNFVDTWAFLDRRIDNIMMLGKGIGVIKTVGLSDALSFVGSRLRRRS